MSREIVSKWLRDMLPKKCMNCGSTKDLQYHHIVPVIYGGNDVPTNIMVLCGNCHSKVHYGKGSTVDHGEAVKIGQERARLERGAIPGRKPTDYETAIRTIAQHSTQFNDIYDSEYEPKTEVEIMEMLGVKNVCYAKCKRMLIEAMQKDVWPYEWAKPKVFRNRPIYDHAIRRMRGEVV